MSFTLLLYQLSRLIRKKIPLMINPDKSLKFTKKFLFTMIKITYLTYHPIMKIKHEKKRRLRG